MGICNCHGGRDGGPHWLRMMEHIDRDKVYIDWVPCTQITYCWTGATRFKDLMRACNSLCLLSRFFSIFLRASLRRVLTFKALASQLSGIHRLFEQRDRGALVLLTALCISLCFLTKPWLSSPVSATLAAFCDLVGGMIGTGQEGDNDVLGIGVQ